MSYWIIGTIILSLISPIFYTKSILAGKAKPHRTTRLIVWLAAVTGVLGVLQSTNVAGLIFAGIFFVRATYLLVMALIHGVGGTSKLDIWSLIIGIAALVVYVLTGNGLLAVAFGVLADAIAYVPTFVKTWHKPESEDPIFFGIEAVAALFAIFAIGELRVDILFPIWFVISSLVVIALIYRIKLVHYLSSRRY